MGADQRPKEGAQYCTSRSAPENEPGGPVRNPDADGGEAVPTLLAHSLAQSV